MCPMIYSVVFGYELKTHTIVKNHTALRDFAFSKNMYIEVKCDLQYDKS